jgi:hypothetical protein
VWRSRGCGGPGGPLVGRSIIEADRGTGASRRHTLTRIALPLPLWIGASGPGEMLGSRLERKRRGPVFEGASPMAMLALVIDWLAANAERMLQPKGLAGRGWVTGPIELLVVTSARPRPARSGDADRACARGRGLHRRPVHRSARWVVDG